MSFLAKISSFLRQHAVTFGGLGIAGAVTVSLAPQTALLSYYKGMVVNNQNGQPLSLDSDLKIVIEKVLTKRLLPTDDEARLDIISSFPNDPVNRGSLKMRFGAFIGLPFSFSYKSVDDIDRGALMVEQRHVDWSTDAGQSLLASLIVSDKAKAFVVARQINYVDMYHLHAETFFRMMCGIGAYTTGFLMNKKFLITERMKFWARFSVFSTVTVVWALLYISVSDAYQCWRDNAADKRAARLSKAYAEGGVEYYESVLKRNQALRSLLGAQGDKRYTRFGNVITLWRTPHVQFTSRRENLRKYLAQYNVGQDSGQTSTNEQNQSS